MCWHTACAPGVHGRHARHSRLAPATGEPPAAASGRKRPLRQRAVRMCHMMRLRVMNLRARAATSARPPRVGREREG